MPKNCLFLPIFGRFGDISPNVVTHRSNPQKAFPCAEIRLLSHNAYKLARRVDLGALPRKRDVRTSQSKSQSGNISFIWREAPTVLIKTKICMVCYFSRHNDVCEVSRCNFRGYDIGVEFPIFILLIFTTVDL